MRRYASALFLSAILCGPAIVSAAGQDNHRYYDSEHKDYHEWNSNEDHAWRHWLEENHHAYHAWTKASKREQREYWKWRHDHPDEH